MTDFKLQGVLFRKEYLKESKKPNLKMLFQLAQLCKFAHKQSVCCGIRKVELYKNTLLPFSKQIN